MVVLCRGMTERALLRPSSGKNVSAISFLWSGARDRHGKIPFRILLDLEANSLDLSVWFDITRHLISAERKRRVCNGPQCAPP